MQGKKVDPTFEVFPENWEAVLMFTRLGTQWIYAGMGEIVGLNYQSVEFFFKIYKVKDRRGMMEDLQSIEQGALSKIRKQNEENRAREPKLPSRS